MVWSLRSVWRPYHILIYYILLTILIQQFYNSVVVILNNVKPNGIPLRSEILCCMWYTSSYGPDDGQG